MADKNTKVRIEPVRIIPTGAEVCHFDELDEEVMQYLAELVSARTGAEQRINDQTAAKALKSCTCDIIKFTEFYRIESY